MTPQSGRRGGPASGIAGVAAIEFAIIFPVLLMLLFGTINVMQELRVNRQLSFAAEVVADTITRFTTTIPTASVDDILLSAQLMVRPAAANTIHVDVYDYFKNAGAATIRWQRRGGGAVNCPQPVVNMARATDPIATILNDPVAPADAVVAVVCFDYVPPIANFPLLNGMFQARRIVKSFALRPRQSTTLALI